MPLKSLKIIKNGYVNVKIDPSLDLVEEINKMRKQKNAVILAH